MPFLFTLAGCALIAYGLAKKDETTFCIGAVILAGVILALTHPTNPEA